jgi:elongator complex protein 2
MTVSDISLDFISVGCNKCVRASDYSKDGYVAYAANNMIALFDPLNGFVRQTLKGHKDRVNSVRFIHQGSELNVKSTFIISGSSDGQVIIWKRTKFDRCGSKSSWELFARLNDHKESVVCVAALSGRSYDNMYFSSSSVDGTVKIYKFNGVAECIQTIECGTRYVTALGLSYLVPNNIPVLATSNTTSTITIYALEDGQFVKKIDLTGHENWVRDLSFCILEDKDGSPFLMLASGAQDKYIRLWKFLLLKEKAEKTFQLSTHSHVVNFGDVSFAVTLESVLIGHEDWVYAVNWKNLELTNGRIIQPMCLLSSSSDKSLMIWCPDEESGAWSHFYRLGETGGSSLGFYNGTFSPCNQYLLGQGYTGSFHLWRTIENEGMCTFEELPCVTGHSGPVEGMSWNFGREYFATVSQDQTTRVFSKYGKEWCEIARPQVHGYDMKCIEFIANFKFVSAGEEKVLRVFEAPKSFIRTFGTLSRKTDEEIKELENQTVVVGANVPALGLSNKAITNEETGLNSHSDNRFQTHFQDVELKEKVLQPPTEYELISMTLWPETEKLYGHGFEIFTVASNRSGSMIASACKSTSSEHAQVILWDTTTWKIIQKLTGHNLTVTKIKFSPCEKFLVSVSRDRQVCLYENVEGLFKLKNALKFHSRIVWDVCWAFDSSFFVTVSRDKTVKVYNTKSGDVKSLELGVSVTAVDVASRKTDSYKIAVGLEDGSIVFLQFLNEISFVKCIPDSLSHSDSVSQVCFGCYDGRWTVTSASRDHSVRVFTLDL